MRRVTISIMLKPALGTRPYSYAEATQSTWAASGEAVRASDRRPGFVDFAVRHAKPQGFVSKHDAKLAPSGIVDGLRHTGLAEFRAGDIADDNQARPLHNRGRRLLRPIFAGIGDMGVDGLHALVLVGPLGHRQGGFMLPRQIGTGVWRRQVRARQLILQPQVNADLGMAQGHARRLDFAVQIDVPVPAGVLAEAARLHHATDRARRPEAQLAAFVGDGALAQPDTASLGTAPSRASACGCASAV